MFSYLKRANAWLEAINTGVVQLIQGQNRNTHVLSVISEKVDTIMADQAALEVAFQSLKSATEKLLTINRQLTASHQNAAPEIDLSPQISEVNSLEGEINDAISNGVTATAAPNVPQPGETAPTTPTDTTSAIGTGTAAGDTSTGTASIGSTASATSTSEPVAETSPSASSTEAETEPTDENTAPHS